MANLKNFTPHPVTIVTAEGTILKTIQSEGLIRLKAETISAGYEIDGVKITTTQFGEAEGLPEFEDGVFYIVSQLVKNALYSRKDLLVPAEVMRDEKGNIVGCKSLGI